MKMLMAAVALVMTVAAPSLTGGWTMKLIGGPHGDATMGLTLTHDGTAVTGTFVSGHGLDLALKGSFVDGELKLEGEMEDHSKVLFSAKLKEDGSLAGYISGPMGDMKWTATRRA